MISRKIITALLMSVCMIGAVTLAFPSEAAAATVSGDYEYSGSQITAYNGQEEELVIPSEIDGVTITAIAESAFEGNEHIVSVVIPDTITTIYTKAFAECPKLQSVTFPAEMYVIHSKAFYNCDALVTVNLPQKLIYTTQSTSVSQYYSGYESPFSECDNLKQITFPEGTTKVTNGLFRGCTGLEKILWADTITEIGNYAFADCDNLENPVIPEHITVIGKSAFEGCDGVTEIVIPDSLETLYAHAFKNCLNLTTVVIEGDINVGSVYSDVPALGCGSYYVGPFAGCTNLKNVTLDENITSIGKGLFAYSGIEEINIPESVTVIGDGAFAGCNQLTKIHIPEGVTSLGLDVFNACSALAEVNIPRKLTTLGYRTFGNCTSLESIEIPKSVTYVNYSDTTTNMSNHVYGPFLGSGISSVVLEDGMTKIPDYLFYGMPSLESVDIPKSVETIGVSSFADCDGLTTFIVPYWIDSIDSIAFANCDNLSHIYLASGTKVYNNLINGVSGVNVYGGEQSYAKGVFENYDSVNFVLNEISAESIGGISQNYTVYNGMTFRILPDITPSNFGDEVVWKTLNENVITVGENGDLTAVSEGTTVIRVFAGDLSADYTVTVVKTPPEVTGIVLSKAEVSMCVSDEVVLSSLIYPTDASQEVEWTSSNENIATVEDGIVKAIAPGTVNITATSVYNPNYYNTCAVTVRDTVICTLTEELESSHNYSNRTDTTWIYSNETADSISVVFDGQTMLEDTFDFIYIYDKSDNMIGEYTGNQLSGKTVTVNGNKIKIRLVTDKAGTEWGFKVSNVLFDGEYIGNVNTQLNTFKLDTLTGYLSGEIVVVEWVDGVSTVPQYTPEMTFVSVDGTEEISVFVTPTGTNTYYFDRKISNLTEDKQYYFKVTSGNKMNVSEYRTVPIYTGTSLVGSEGILGYLNGQDISYTTSSNGEFILSGVTREYDGQVNSQLMDVEYNSSDYGGFVSGHLVVVEWIDRDEDGERESYVPNSLPEMFFESTDGEEITPVFIVGEGTNTYYFDRNLSEDMDTSKEYIFRLNLTNEKNVSSLKSMVLTTNYMEKKEGILWETATQIINYKTVWADGDNQLRIYAVNK